MDKRFLLTNNNVLHVAGITETGRRLTAEECQIDQTTGWRILRLGEDFPAEVRKCGHCFKDSDTETSTV